MLNQPDVIVRRHSVTTRGLGFAFYKYGGEELEDDGTKSRNRTEREG